MLTAVLLTDAHELAEGENSGALQLTSILSVLHYILDDAQPFRHKGVLWDGVGQTLQSLDASLEFSFNATHHLIQLLLVLVTVVLIGLQLQLFQLGLETIQMNEELQRAVRQREYES